jgi:hypothetical protein
MRHEGYYYGILTLLEKIAYGVIYRGLAAHDKKIILKLDITSGQLRKVFLRVMYDNPILFYVNQTIIRRIGEPGNWTIWPVYLYDGSETELLTRKIKDKVDQIAAGGKPFYGNEIMTEKYLHDYVAKSVVYDYEDPKSKERFDAHSIVGALLDKRAVCEGIAKAFKFLCEESGIKCIVVYGMAKGSYHSWNMVSLRQEFYHVDVTWDRRGYDYFNVTTEEIMRDHLPIGAYPLCTATLFHNFRN